MKAVNQCVGRVIRHSNDFAAIILADSRYLVGTKGKRPLDKLPAWMRLSACEEELEFGPLMGRLHKFFRSHLKPARPG